MKFHFSSLPHSASARSSIVRASSGNLTLTTLATVIALSGCQKPGAGPAGGPPQMPPTAVETAVVVTGSVADRFRAVGTLVANEEVTVVAEIEGTVTELPFKEGEMVARNALLARIDDAELAAQVARAEALLEQSQTSFERTRRVVAEQILSPQSLDDATASRKVAEANLDLARVRLSKASVRAPFDGVIGARLVSPGAWLQAGDAIARLVDISEVKVDFAVPERYLAQLRPGGGVVVAAAAFPEWEANGQIELVDPSLNPNTRNVRMRARVANPGARLKPGMSVDVTVVLAERPQAITIPSEAVFAEGDRFYAYVVNADSTVARALLTLGTRTASEVEVVAGLSPGQVVVRAGQQKLYEGAKVAAVAPSAAAPGVATAATPAGGGK